jgi:hypothetical protein
MAGSAKHYKSGGGAGCFPAVSYFPMAKRCISLHATNLAQLPQHNFEETPFFVVEGEFVEHGFDVTMPPDIEFKPDFPNCCGYHAGLLAQATDWFGKFPNCCPWHQELARQP